jgi:hypothetical protein
VRYLNLRGWTSEHIVPFSAFLMSVFGIIDIYPHVMDAFRSGHFWSVVGIAFVGMLTAVNSPKLLTNQENTIVKQMQQEDAAPASNKLITGFLIVALLAGNLAACSALRVIPGVPNAPPPTQVQVTVAAADLNDAANQLGELVLQWQDASHKLHQAGVTTASQDNTVQQFAIVFADSHDQAIVLIHKATTLGELYAAAAPLLGSATAIMSSLKQYAGLKPLMGAPAVVSASLTTSLAKGDALLKKLGGK